MKLTPIYQYVNGYSVEGKTDIEIIDDVQLKIVEHFKQINPKKSQMIEKFTLDTTPLSLANHDVYLLGIVINNILEEFGIYKKIKNFGEVKQFPDMETLIGYIFHELTKDR